MLATSRAERNFILAFLILGLGLTGISYHKKITSPSNLEIVDIDKPRLLIDINSASALELERLPGIGPVLASDIVAHRERRGGFENIDELKDIKGIGDKKLEKIKDLVSVSE